MNSLFRKYFLSISPRAFIELINQFSAVISLPLIVYSLNIEAYGFFTFFIFLVYFFSTLSNWGLPVHIMERKAKDSKYYYKISQYFFLINTFQLLGLITTILILLISLQYKFNIFIYDQINLIALILLAILYLFNPIQLMQALGVMNKLIIPNLISRIVFLYLIVIFRDNLDINLLINIFLISTVIPIGYSYLLIFKKFNFLFKNFRLDMSFCIDLIKISKNTIFLFLANNYFLIFISFLASFKYDIYQLAILNFLIQLYRPGLAMVELLMRLTWQASINIFNKEQKKIEFFIVIILITAFLTLSIFGYNLFILIFSEIHLIELWPQVKLLLYLLCLDTFYFYISYIHLYKKINNLYQSELIILNTYWIQFITIFFFIFFNFEIIHLISTYFICKSLQTIYLIFKTKKII